MRIDILSLPTEILWEIMLLLPYKELSYLCRLNTRFWGICKDDIFWIHKTSIDFGLNIRFLGNSRIVYQILHRGDKVIPNMKIPDDYPHVRAYINSLKNGDYRGADYIFDKCLHLKHAVLETFALGDDKYLIEIINRRFNELISDIDTLIDLLMDSDITDSDRYMSILLLQKGKANLNSYIDSFGLLVPMLMNIRDENTIKHLRDVSYLYVLNRLNLYIDEEISVKRHIRSIRFQLDFHRSIRKTVFDIDKLRAEFITKCNQIKSEQHQMKYQ